MLRGCRMYRMSRHAGAAGSSNPAAAAGPCSSFTSMLGCFLAPSEATPELFFHPPLLLSVLPMHAHAAEAFYVFWFSSAGRAAPWMLGVFARSEREGCRTRSAHSLRPCLSASDMGKPTAFPRHTLLATGRGGPWAGWTWSSLTQHLCCKHNPRLRQGGDSPKM